MTKLISEQPALDQAAPVLGRRAVAGRKGVYLPRWPMTLTSRGARPALLLSTVKDCKTRARTPSPAQGQRSWPCWGPQHPSQEPWTGCLEKRSQDSKYNPLVTGELVCTQNRPVPHLGSHCIGSFCLAVCIHVHLLCAGMVPGARPIVLNSTLYDFQLSSVALVQPNKKIIFLFKKKKDYWNLQRQEVEIWTNHYIQK